MRFGGAHERYSALGGDDWCVAREMQLPVGSLEYCVSNVQCVAKGEVVCAAEGMRVVRNPRFPLGEEQAGRVQDGVGEIVDVNVGLENISVAWEQTGDRTVWTRAGSRGFDVVVGHERSDNRREDINTHK